MTNYLIFYIDTRCLKASGHYSLWLLREPQEKLVQIVSFYPSVSFSQIPLFTSQMENGTICVSESHTLISSKEEKTEFLFNAKANFENNLMNTT